MIFYDSYKVEKKMKQEEIGNFMITMRELGWNFATY